LGVFLLAIVIIVLLVIYEFMFKKRRRKESLGESLEGKDTDSERIPSHEEPEDKPEDILDEFIESIHSYDEDQKE
jgi:hypothetical protein